MDSVIQPEGRHLVVTVHGIRTFGGWQERLENLANESGQTKSIEFNHYRYGYFSILAFIIPIFRWLVVLRFRNDLRRLLKQVPNSRVDLIGHSFGTHVIAWALWGLRPEEEIRIHTVILSGSVLNPGFRWSNLIGTRVKRVVNDCGTKDIVLIINQFFVLFTGMAGRVGLIGMTSDIFRNRYSAFGHSGYFEDASGRPTNHYMREQWLPLLVGDDPVPYFGEPPATGAWNGFLIWFSNNSEPIKLTLYGALLFIPLMWINGLREEAVFQAQAAKVSSRKGAVVLARLAERELDAGRTRSAILVAAEALPNNSRATPDLVVPEAKSAIISALSSPVEKMRLLHNADVLMAAFSDDQKSIITGDDEFGVRFWSAETGELREFREPSEYLDRGYLPAIFSRNGLWFLTARSNFYPTIHHVPGREETWFESARNDQNGLAFSAGGLRFSTADFSDSTLRIAETIGAKLVAELKDASCSFASTAFHPFDQSVAATCQDGSIRFWQDGDPKTAPVSFALFRGARTWDNRFKPPVAFDRTGEKIAVGMEDGTIVMWDVSDPVKKPRRFKQFKAARNRPTHIAFSNDNTKMVIGFESGALQISEPSNSRFSVVLTGHSERINTAYFNASGSLLVSSSADRTARVWQLVTEAPSKVLNVEEGYIHRVIFSPDGKKIAALSFGNLLTLWDAETLTAQKIPRSLDGLHFLAFDQKGKRLGGGNNSNPYWFDPSTRQRKPMTRGWVNLSGVEAVAVSPDDRLMAFGSTRSAGRTGTEIHVWDPDKKKPLMKFSTPDGFAVTALAFDPTGQWLFAGYHDGEIRQWPIALGPQQGAEDISSIRTFNGHQDRIFAIATDFQGKRIVSGSRDGSIRVWDVQTGAVLGYISSPYELIAAVRFTGDMIEYATVVAMKTIRLRSAAPIPSDSDLLKAKADSMDLCPLNPCERAHFGLKQLEPFSDQMAGKNVSKKQSACGIRESGQKAPLCLTYQSQN